MLSTSPRGQPHTRIQGDRGDPSFAVYTVGARAFSRGRAGPDASAAALGTPLLPPPTVPSGPRAPARFPLGIPSLSPPSGEMERPTPTPPAPVPPLHRDNKMYRLAHFLIYDRDARVSARRQRQYWYFGVLHRREWPVGVKPTSFEHEGAQESHGRPPPTGRRGIGARRPPRCPPRPPPPPRRLLPPPPPPPPLPPLLQDRRGGGSCRTRAGGRKSIRGTAASTCSCRISWPRRTCAPSSISRRSSIRSVTPSITLPSSRHA